MACSLDIYNKSKCAVSSDCSCKNIALAIIKRELTALVGIICCRVYCYACICCSCIRISRRCCRICSARVHYIHIYLICCVGVSCPLCIERIVLFRVRVIYIRIVACSATVCCCVPRCERITCSCRNGCCRNLVRYICLAIA